MPAETKTHRILRLIFMLSNSYPKTKAECTAFLEIKSAAFYKYCNTLRETGFDLHQKDGSYWIDYNEKEQHIMKDLLHFSEEEAYLLSCTIDSLDENPGCSARLKQKLVSFLNYDKTIDAYIRKEKNELIGKLRKAQLQRKQILLVNYASGNSQTVKNRMVEPFEFKDDFNLLWAFDTEVKRNRQFKVCRIEDVIETPFAWQNELSHLSSPVDIFRNTGELDKKIEFSLNLRAKNLLTEEYPISGKFLTRISQNLYEFKASVAKYEGPGRFVLGVAEDIQPKGDEGFLKYLKIKINKLQNILGESTNYRVMI